MNAIEKILKVRLVPAATIEDITDAEPLAEALLAGGLNIIEITFRTAAAAEAIRRIAKRFPDMLLGAGTVLTQDQLERAIDAGISFAVAPGLNEDFVRQADAAGVSFVPGVMTPTEIDLALRAGARLLKFFPAETSGGVGALKAFAGPFAHTGVKFIPTGGISPANAAAYLALPVVGAVGGSWMVKKDLVKARNWAEITRLSRQAVALAASR